jgi:putative transposase
LVPGGSFFFTLVTEKRRPVFSNPESVDLLRKALRQVK